MNGIAFCGMEAAVQVSRLISRACGSGLRAWISLVSRISRLPFGSAMYARLPSPLSVIPCEKTLPCQTACGAFGSVTSIAVIDCSAVLVA